jgi:photosystem II stability/assembly factor-like uncharacterized protein
VLLSDDGGETWRTATTGSGMSLWAVHVASPLRTWIVGDEGTVLSTPDGGATWEQHFYSPEKDAAARPQRQQR